MGSIYEVGDLVVIPERKRTFLGVNYNGERITIGSVNTGYKYGIYLISGTFEKGGREFHIQFISDDCVFWLDMRDEK